MGIARRFVPPSVRPELFGVGHLHELYRLLNLRFESFSQEAKRTTIEALRNIPIPDGDEEGPGRVERLQFRWLSAISATSYAPAAKWFGKLAAKYGSPPKYPDYLSHIETRWGPGASQYSAEELVAFAEQRTLVQKLAAFKPSDSWEGPTVDALTDQLERAVQLAPVAFIRIVPELLVAAITYQHAVIAGFLKLWREPNAARPFEGWDDSWPKLFDFFEALLANPTFWDGKGGAHGFREVTPMWIASSIADLLHAGTLAGRSRRLLRDQEQLLADDIGAFAADLQQLHDWQPQDVDGSEEQYRTNSIAGGIAVLIIQHREWLSQNPAIERWCLETIRTISPVYAEHDSPMSSMDHTAESFLGEIGVALLCERDDEWVLRMAITGITGFYYSSPWFAMWRACLLRGRLTARFDELVNIVALWSALRRAAQREARHIDDAAVRARWRQIVFTRLIAGRLQGPMISLQRIERLGRRLVARVSRRSMSAAQRRVEAARREWMLTHHADRKLSREIPDIDPEVLQRGLGFLPRIMREPVASDGSRASHIVRELCDFELRMLSLAEPDEGEWKIDGTPHYFEVWIMEQVAELIAHASSEEERRSYYRPILALGPAAGHWVEAFLRAWIRVGLDVTSSPESFRATWQEMARYAMGLRRWQPRRPGIWNPAETISVDLMGLRKEAVAVLGQSRHLDVVTGMAAVFEEWTSKWLEHAMPAAWFAHFLTTESGRVLIPTGIIRLATIVTTFEDRDWHQHDLGALFTQVLASCWTHFRRDVEAQQELRRAFLDILTHLCARQVPEALHLRNRVSGTLGAA